MRQSGTTVVQVGEGADENFLGYWWCEHYRKKELEVYDPARKAARSWFRRASNKLTLNGRTPTSSAARERGQELFWGGAVCWWGGLRDQLTPNPGPFAASGQLPRRGAAARTRTGSSTVTRW